MADKKFMMIAIEEAKKGSIPFGAVIVKDNKIIAKAHNSVDNDEDPTAHAEINVIKNACKSLNSKDLKGCTLYSSWEPCPMCFMAAWWANISSIIYGGEDEDVPIKEWRLNVKCIYLNEKTGNKIKIKGGFLKELCLDLFKDI